MPVAVRGGFGVGPGWPHLLSRVLLVADEDEQDLAAASLTTVQLIVSALGAALAGMVANLAGLTDPGGEPGASSAATWLFGVFAVAPAVAVLTAVRCTRGFGGHSTCGAVPRIIAPHRSGDSIE
jgi:hypothetical protein